MKESHFDVVVQMRVVGVLVTRQKKEYERFVTLKRVHMIQSVGQVVYNVQITALMINSEIEEAGEIHERDATDHNRPNSPSGSGDTDKRRKKRQH